MKHQRIRFHRAFRQGTISLALLVTFNTPIVPRAAVNIPPEPASSVEALSATLAEADSTTREEARQTMARVPLSFELNQGQADSRVRFLSRGPGYNVYLTPDETVLTLRTRKADDPEGWLRSRRDRSKAGRSAVIRMKLSGANPNPTIAGLEPLPGKANYLIGDDRSRWQRGVPTYSKVSYEQVYPGIDVVYYGRQKQLEYDFVVSPGADPRSIDVAFGGARRIKIDASGNLVLETAVGRVVQHPPVAYQESEGGRREVPARYVLRSRNNVGFEVGLYDRGKKLIIDPVISFLTYLGGTNSTEVENLGDIATGIVVDSFGNAYVTGTTDTGDFPVSGGAFQDEKKNDVCDISTPNFVPCGDVFVTKLNASGSGIQYSTYIGSGRDDAAFGIAVTSNGEACITGGTDPFKTATFQPKWPTTSNSFQGNPFSIFNSGDYSDAFVTLLDPFGSDLVYSTYYSGRDVEVGRAIAVDANGRVYVTGETFSNNLPMKNGFQTSLQGIDAFVAKFDPDETRDADTLLYATYLGGSGPELGKGIAVDQSNRAYVVGQTGSFDFDFKNGFQTDQNGQDGFIAKINPSSSGASSLVYSSHIGGNLIDNALAVAVNSQGQAYIAGTTESTSGFPLVNAIDSTMVSTEAFIAKVSATGNQLIYSTFLGGNGNEEARGIAVDSFGLAYVAGRTTNGATFPVVNQIAGAAGSGIEAFVARLSSDGQTLSYSTLLGGSGTDAANAIDVNRVGAAYVAGQTTSSNLPVSANAFQNVRRGPVDAFIAKITPRTDLVITIDDAPDPVLVGTNVNYNFTITNNGPEIATDVDLLAALPGGNQASFVSASTGCTPGGSLNCEVADELLPGDSVTVSVVLNTLTVTTLQVVALVFLNESDVGPNLNFDVETTVVQNAGGQTADMRIQIADSPDPVQVGQNVTYTITVTNNGPDTATNVTVTDNLPSETTFQSIASNGTCSTPPVGGTGTVSCSFASIASGASQTLTLVLNVRKAGNGLTNIVTVSSAVADPNGTNNSATAVTTTL